MDNEVPGPIVVKVNQKILFDVFKERERQDEKWGEQNHDDIYWLGVLVEEVGSCAKAILEYIIDIGPRPEVRRELVQIVAVGIAWLECLDRKSESGVHRHISVKDKGHGEDRRR